MEKKLELALKNEIKNMKDTPENFKYDQARTIHELAKALYILSNIPKHVVVYEDPS